jgi:hypothetical protein
MLGVVDRVCTEGLAVAPGAPPPTVALVVGSAHLPGEHLRGIIIPLLINVGPVATICLVGSIRVTRGRGTRCTTAHRGSGGWVSTSAR